MRRLLTLTMLLTLLGTLLPVTATAQAWDPCGDALNGVYPDGYEVLWAPERGGSGSQIVLGTDGDEYLRGGSGHDILCGYGGNDVLDGGSGDDWMDAGIGTNELYGGSGDDTMIGMESDVFDGGSGANEIITDSPALSDCELANTYDYNAGVTPDLSGLNLAGCVLAFEDIEGRFWYANFAGSDLSGAALDGDFDYADFSGANLSGATLRGDYDYATFIGADLSGAYTNCACIGNDFSGAILSGVTLANGGFRDSNLANVDLSYTYVESFSFLNTNLSGANFTGADIRHVSLWHNLTYANFTDATFYYTSFLVADLTGADFTGAIFSDGVEWTETTCPDGTSSYDNGNTCEGHLLA